MSKGINAYSRANSQGGVTVDVERMLVDLITVLKASGFTKEHFQNFAVATWDAVKVEVSIPRLAKN